MLNDALIEQIVADSGEPPYRPKQIKRWVYRQGVLDFFAMSDIPLALQQRLHDACQPASLTLVKAFPSRDDQTIKYALRTRDGNLVEIVVLNYQSGRVSLCISSQIGCAVGCSFCATGKMGFVRDLTSEEICDQILVARHILMQGLRDRGKENKKTVLPSNVIIMGMGEPFLNYDNTLEALQRIQKEFGIGGRRLTVSTAGILPGIEKFTEENLQVNLAVSLHAVDDGLRSQLVPINKKYDLKALKKAVQRYLDATKRKVFFEYVMLRDVNDSAEQAAALAAWLPEGLAHVNLIRFNSIADCPLQPSPRERVESFKLVLEKHHIPVTIRHPMGDDIAAACGQLAGKIKEEKK